MPDWFYRTISRPLLLAVPPRQAQQFAVGFMSTVGRLPLGLGTRLIDFLGHMRPPETLRLTCGGTELPGPVGLGHLVDPDGKALQAWSKFGFGLVELGPITDGDSASNMLQRDPRAETITVGVPPPKMSAKTLVGRLREFRKQVKVAVFVRLWITNDQSPRQAAVYVARSLDSLRSEADAFSVDRSSIADVIAWGPGEWGEFWGAMTELCPSWPRAQKLYWVLSSQECLLWRAANEAARKAGLVGLILESREETLSTRTHGKLALSQQLATLRTLRSEGGTELGLIASGGIHEPADAVALLQAGANVVLIDTGLIYSGPGLPKRINEAVLYQQSSEAAGAEPTQTQPVFRYSWFWTLMLGVAMLTGSLLALWIASNAVVMPYDEVFCGLTVE